MLGAGTHWTGALIARLTISVTKALFPEVYAVRSSRNCNASILFKSAYTFASPGWAKIISERQVLSKRAASRRANIGVMRKIVNRCSESLTLGDTEISLMDVT